MAGSRGARISNSPLMPQRSLFASSSQGSGTFKWQRDIPRFGGGM